MRLIAFVVSFLTAMFSVNCAGQQLTPEQQRTLDLFECRVRVLQPYVGSVYDTAAIVRAWSRGNQDLVALFHNLGYLDNEVEAASKAMGSCLPVVAPPPLPGDKVVGL